MGKPAPTLYRTYADGSISGNRAHHSGAWPTHAPIGTWIAKLSSRTLLPRTRRQPRTAGPRRINATHTRPLARCSEWRSEEHTSELQSLMRISYAVFCLKKKKAIL